MAYEPCRRCGVLRKWGDYFTLAEGFHVPQCNSCGDPAYYDNDNDDEGDEAATP